MAKSLWRKKYKSLKEYYAHEYDNKFYEFTPEELQIDPDETAEDTLVLENYSHEKQLEELKKCHANFFYFCHKYVKILHLDRGLLPFIPYKYQRFIIGEYGEHRWNIISKFRQGGLTTLTVIWGLWRCMFREHELIMLLSKTDREAIAAGLILDRALDYMPAWLKPDMEDSKHEKFFPDNDMRFCFYTPEAARGRTIKWLLIDEAAHIKNMDEHWKAMYPTIATGGNSIVISTVNGIGNWYEETFHAAQEGNNPFHVIEVDYVENPDYDNPKWVAQTKAILGESGWQQEVLRLFLGSGTTYVRPDIIGELKEYTKEIDPVRKLFPEWNNQDEIRNTMEKHKKEIDFEDWDKGALWIFKEPIDGREYVIGVDVADGIGENGDNSCFEVIDLSDLSQVAEFYSNLTPTDDFAKILAVVGRTYNHALIVVENMAQGKSVLDKLHHQLQYDNLYFENIRSIDKPGIRVTSANRSLILESLQSSLANHKIIINSKRFVKELGTFIFDKRLKKPIAVKGKHDDAIFAVAHALYAKDDFIRNMPVGAEPIITREDPCATENYQRILEEMSKGAPEDWLDWEEDIKEQTSSEVTLSYFQEINKRPAWLNEWGW